MEILQNFGVQPVLLLAQIVNFLIIFWLLKKFMFKPVLQLLNDRRKTIEEGLKDAEKNQQLLEETEKREKEVLKNAQAEARKLLDETKKQGAMLMAESKQNAKAEVDRMLKDAKEQIAQESRATEKRLAAQVNRLAADLLKASVQDLFTDVEQTSIMRAAAKKFKVNS